MFFIKRSDKSLLSKWFFQIDKRIIGLTLSLILIGFMVLFTAGPYAARRIGYPALFFFYKYTIPAAIGFGAMIFCSFLSKETIKKLSYVGLIFGIGLLLMTLIHPMVIKGSKRWINLGMQIQPSEILKPFWIVFCAIYLTKIAELAPGRFFKDFKKVWKQFAIVGGTTALIIGILFAQPDFGMSLIYMIVFAIMLFLAGTSLFSAFISLGGGLGLFCLAYLLLSHVRGRVNAFFGLGAGTDTYQVEQATDCIRHGGIFGKWGDSYVKAYLPDSHTDFVFATIAEDVGAILAIGVLLIYFLIITRVLSRMTIIKDKFTMIAVGGIISIFAGQIFVNISTNLSIMPPKGMTLPFISYGGSSLVSFCILFGFLLALIRADKYDFSKQEVKENESN